MLSRLALRNVATRYPALARVQSSSAVEPQRRSRPLHPDPVRHGFIPEEWFQFFYNKTGYTGPYMFTFGLSTYLISKEFYVLEHEYYTGIACLLMSIILVKNLGPGLAKYLDSEMDKEEAEIKKTREDDLHANEEAIKHELREQWRSEAQKMIMDAKKENIKIQLEATYRERAYNVYNEVKKRLDYQLQIANVERRIAQKHMAQWIINNVVKSITPEQEKAALEQCISELQALAPRS
ncbi:ATP synthase subunit b, mitochondrial [Microplitis demolitor]|uniref:ATP synthase subunit b, mitochondrial n=1 Tax=Microplitis demolitor TaxID=69319 RepID=UPI000440033C|nr:ATP synthase subunit b, mitochondrial [Microplitis demolitor]